MFFRKKLGKMQKGEVWWANFPAPMGRRPVLLLSRDSAYIVRTAILVAPLTATIRDTPVEVTFEEISSIDSGFVIDLDSIMTVPISILTEPIARLAKEKMEDVHKALSFAFDL
ncbi:MAG: type II toxin-antitoxin system PemK/MazF family toxin [SAR202 cluster bacterium]|nr:type II toxin-antitoxin system PemK/MazF family toxin [SAR202 cluster bacterium]